MNFNLQYKLYKPHVEIIFQSAILGSRHSTIRAGLYRQKKPVTFQSQFSIWASFRPWNMLVILNGKWTLSQWPFQNLLLQCVLLLLFCSWYQVEKSSDLTAFLWKFWFSKARTSWFPIFEAMLTDFLPVTNLLMLETVPKSGAPWLHGFPTTSFMVFQGDMASSLSHALANRRGSRMLMKNSPAHSHRSQPHHLARQLHR